eukprot:3088617-Heterocapsa_arctica.AAC.1
MAASWPKLRLRVGRSAWRQGAPSLLCRPSWLGLAWPGLAWLGLLPPFTPLGVKLPPSPPFPPYPL